MEHESLNSRRSQDLFKLIYTLRSSNNIKVGYNETIKAVNNGIAQLVVVAKDAVPSCLVEPLPILCEQKGVQYVFVDSKTALGKACSMEIDVLACALFVPKHDDTTKIASEISKVLK